MQRQQQPRRHLWVVVARTTATHLHFASATRWIGATTTTTIDGAASTLAITTRARTQFRVRIGGEMRRGEKPVAVYFPPFKVELVHFDVRAQKYAN